MLGVTRHNCVRPSSSRWKLNAKSGESVRLGSPATTTFVSNAGDLRRARPPRVQRWEHNVPPNWDRVLFRFTVHCECSSAFERSTTIFCVIPGPLHHLTYSIVAPALRYQRDARLDCSPTSIV